MAAGVLIGGVDLELVIGRGVVAAIAGIGDAAIEDVADERLSRRFGSRLKLSRNPKNRALEKNKSTEKISFCHDAWMYFSFARYDHDVAKSA